MGKNGRGILKLADYFREAKNPCDDCRDREARLRSDCLTCGGTGRQSANEKNPRSRRYPQLYRVFSRRYKDNNEWY